MQFILIIFTSYPLQALLIPTPAFCFQLHVPFLKLKLYYKDLAN